MTLKYPLTRESFIEELGKAVKEGKLTQYDPTSNYRSMVRLALAGDPSSYHCPITAVCEVLLGMKYDPMEYRHAAHRLGLSDDDARLIIYASDNEGEGPENLRTRIQEAVTP